MPKEPAVGSPDYIPIASSLHVVATRVASLEARLRESELTIEWVRKLINWAEGTGLEEALQAYVERHVCVFGADEFGRRLSLAFHGDERDADSPDRLTAQAAALTEEVKYLKRKVAAKDESIRDILKIAKEEAND